MPEITVALLLTILAAGAVAGCLGALLGIGGGVFLVPFLNSVVGLDLRVAIAVSLMTVIATSSAVSARTSGRQLINLRLGMLLEVASAAGGAVAGVTFHRISEHALLVTFAVVTATVAALMLTRLDRRNVILADGAEPGVLGGRFFDDESGREVVYRVKRLPVGLGVSAVAGYISGMLGIGGGVLKVPVLNAWCGVPMRAAAATSALMIGVTAVASAPIQYARGFVPPPLAAAAIIGVLIGSQGGFWFGGRARARWLKLLMAVVLAFVSIVYFMKAL
ncbi:MAG: sulfite exporter TauE/SafE family protein [Vicinamibacterales bacterium]